MSTRWNPGVYVQNIYTYTWLRHAFYVSFYNTPVLDDSQWPADRSNSARHCLDPLRISRQHFLWRLSHSSFPTHWLQTRDSQLKTTLTAQKWLPDNMTICWMFSSWPPYLMLNRTWIRYNHRRDAEFAENLFLFCFSLVVVKRRSRHRGILGLSTPCILQWFLKHFTRTPGPDRSTLLYFQ